MTRFVQNNTVSFTVHFKKKRTQNDAVLIGTIHLLLPLDVLQAGEEEVCSPATSLSLLETQKSTRLTPMTN
jgi:hypothetical protein